MTLFIHLWKAGNFSKHLWAEWRRSTQKAQGLLETCWLTVCEWGPSADCLDPGKLDQAILDVHRWLGHTGLGWLCLPKLSSPIIYKNPKQWAKHGSHFFFLKSFWLKLQTFFSLPSKAEAKFHGLSSERSDKYFKTSWDRTENHANKQSPRGSKWENCFSSKKMFVLIQVVHVPHHSVRKTV